MSDVYALVQFIDAEENPLSDLIQVPSSITLEHMKKIMPNLDNFFVYGVQIKSSLNEILSTLKYNIENVIPIKCVKEGLSSSPALFCNSSFSGHEQAVLCLRIINTIEENASLFYNNKIQPNKRHVLVSGGGDATVRFWDSLTKTQKNVQNVHSHWILSIDIYRDLVICGSLDGKISLFTINGDFIKHFVSQNKGIVKVRFKHRKVKKVQLECKDIESILKNVYNDATLISAGRDGSITEWDLDGRIIFSYRHTSCCDDFVMDGDCLVSCDRSGKIIIYENKKYSCELSPHTRRINSLDKKGIFLASGSDDFKVRVYKKEKNNWTSYKELLHKNIVSSVKISENKIYIASSSFDRTVRLWDLLSGNLISSYFHSGEVYKLLFINNLVISCGKDKAIKSFCATNKKVVSSLDCGDEVFDVDYCQGVLVGGCRDRKVYFFA